MPGQSRFHSRSWKLNGGQVALDLQQCIWEQDSAQNTQDEANTDLALGASRQAGFPSIAFFG